MSEHSGDEPLDDPTTGPFAGVTDDPSNEAIDDTPTITCERCNDRWTLTYELDVLRVGNQAIEQFALDHKRHTGHFPDEISPWIARCRQCPDGEEFLSERPARRWARTHARHTRHAIELTDGCDTEIVESPIEEDRSPET